MNCRRLKNLNIEFIIIKIHTLRLADETPFIRGIPAPPCVCFYYFACWASQLNGRENPDLERFCNDWREKSWMPEYCIRYCFDICKHVDFKKIIK